MTTSERFRNPPLIEAVVDLKALLPADSDVKAIRDLHSQIASKYPQSDERAPWRAEISLKAGEDVSGKSKLGSPDGYIFWSSDRKRVVQFKLDGFTFSCLKPYPGWPEMTTEAERLWKLYRDTLKPLQVFRIGVRYINKVIIPLQGDHVFAEGIIDFDDFIVGLPKIPTGCPQVVEQFMSRVLFPVAVPGGKAILTMAHVPPQEDGAVAVTLDIDVFSEATMEPAGPELWGRVEALKGSVKMIFMNTLTPKARSLFG